MKAAGRQSTNIEDRRPPPEVILALDLGTRAGWACRDLWQHEAPGRIEFGVQEFELQRGESPGMRFVRFNRWLAKWPGVQLVVYEQAHHRGGAATEVGVGLVTRVQEWAARVGIEHAGVHTATLKKWTTGNGRADKAAMIAAVERRWDHVVTDDNEADALALLHYAMEEMT